MTAQLSQYDLNYNPYQGNQLTYGQGPEHRYFDWTRRPLDDTAPIPTPTAGTVTPAITPGQLSSKPSTDYGAYDSEGPGPSGGEGPAGPGIGEQISEAVSTSTMGQLGQAAMDNENSPGGRMAAAAAIAGLVAAPGPLSFIASLLAKPAVERLTDYKYNKKNDPRAPAWIDPDEAAGWGGKFDWSPGRGWEDQSPDNDPANHPGITTVHSEELAPPDAPPWQDPDKQEGAPADDSYGGYGGHGSGNWDGASDDGSFGWVVCTYFVDRGLLARAPYEVSAGFSLSMSDRFLRGYYLWAIPAVRRLRQHKAPVLRAVLLWFATHRTMEVAHRVDPATYPARDWQGSLIRWIFEPSSWLLGWLVDESSRATRHRMKRDRMAAPWTI